jgi:hypothetical protein
MTAPPAATPEARRGRPSRLAYASPDRPGRQGFDERMGWLLRVNRLLGADESLVTATQFAAALRFRAGSGPASPAQVSRWETGAVRVDYRTVRQYERLLELPVNSLVAMADRTGRRRTGGPGRESLDRRLDPDEPAFHRYSGQLLERALSGGLMDGPAWDDLTVRFAALPAVFLHPPGAWEELAHRLLSEMVVADGLAWSQRDSALGRLLRHPSSGAMTIAACAAFAADPAHQIFAEPLSDLHVTDHPDAYRLVLAQLCDPSSSRALYGALVAAIRKVDRLRLSPEDLATVLGAVHEVVADPRAPDEVRQLVPVLLRRLPAAAPGQVVRELHRVVAADPVGRLVLGSGRTEVSDAARVVVARVVASATSRLRRDLPGADTVLPELLDELLFSPDPGDRLHAGFLIAATPYRETVSAALTEEVVPALRGDGGHLVAVLAALGALGHGTDRGLLEHLVLAPAVNPAVNEAAARAIGLVPGRSGAGFWAAALRRHLAVWQETHAPTSLTTLRRLVQALGTAEERALLTAVGADQDIPSAVRTAAGWWLTLARDVRLSAVS